MIDAAIAFSWLVTVGMLRCRVMFFLGVKIVMCGGVGLFLLLGYGVLRFGFGFEFLFYTMMGILSRRKIGVGLNWYSWDKLRDVVVDV